MEQSKVLEWLLPGFIDSSGNPLANGKVYSYAAGTTTRKALHTDEDRTAEATNPVILDSLGQAKVFGRGIYKFVVKTSDDVTVATFDNVRFGEPDEDLEDIELSITTAGSDQTDATQLAAKYNVVDTVSDTEGLKLPQALEGREILVTVNSIVASDATIKLYPYDGDTINPAAADAPILLKILTGGTSSTTIFGDVASITVYCSTEGEWDVIGLSGFVNLETGSHGYGY